MRSTEKCAEQSRIPDKCKKCLHMGRSNYCTNGVVRGAKAWGIRSAERRKVNVLEMKCLRSLITVLRMDRIRNQEVRRRARIEGSCPV